VQPPDPWGGPPPNQGQQAGNALLKGFAGCLGVGLAILAVLVVVILVVAVAAHH
jgi:hypothetical protein